MSAFDDNKDSSITFRLQNYGALENKLLSANADIKSLREQLAKERELRKELVENLWEMYKYYPKQSKEIEALIQKAKGT